MKISKEIFYVSSGFAGGFMVGYLASNYRESLEFKGQKKRIDQVVSRFSHIIHERQKQFAELNHRIRKELKDPIPDLYEATEGLSLDESELIYE